MAALAQVGLPRSHRGRRLLLSLALTTPLLGLRSALVTVSLTAAWATTRTGKGASLRWLPLSRLRILFIESPMRTTWANSSTTQVGLLNRPSLCDVLLM